MSFEWLYLNAIQIPRFGTDLLKRLQPLEKELIQLFWVPGNETSASSSAKI